MYVYRFLNKKDKVIYIGKTKNLEKRFKNHKHLPKMCYRQTNKIEYIELNNNDESSIYERYYINLINPRYNKIYKHKSEFGFILPDKKWKKFDFAFKETIIDRELNVSELPLTILCEDDVNLEEYLMFSELIHTDDDYLRMFKILVFYCSLGILLLEDNEDYKKQDMLDLLSDLYEMDIIDIKSKLPLGKSECDEEAIILEFKEKNLFGEFYDNYKYYKTLSKEKKEGMLNSIKTSSN